MLKKMIQGCIFSVLFLFACASNSPQEQADAFDVSQGGDTGQWVCHPKQEPPYLASPYPSIHGNAGNNETIPCSGPETAPKPGWQALDGKIIFNPITAGLGRLYAVVTTLEGCRLWYIDLKDGSEHCLTQQNPDALSFGVLGSSPELDDKGNVYVTDGWEDVPDSIVSFTRDGALRWKASFKGLRAKEPEKYMPPLGLVLMRDGFAATVTPDGMAVTVDMTTGKVKGHYSLIDDANMAPLKPPEGSTMPTTVPKYVECRLKAALGGSLSTQDMLAALAGGTGGSGAYTDNSVAASKDLLFVVGGGPDHDGDHYAENGALVALKVTDGQPSLWWYMPTNGATGSSPTIDPTGRFVVVTDLNDQGKARLVTADIDVCNKLAEKGQRECAPAWTFSLEGKALNASVSMDGDFVVYAWNQGKDPDPQNPMADLVAVQGPATASEKPSIKWTASFPAARPAEWDSNEWSSTVLVLKNMIVGVVSHIKSLPLQMPIPMATKLQHEVVGVRRSDGKVLWRRVNIDDAPINSPVLGSDGNIYIPILGMLDLMKVPDGKKVDSCDDFQDTDFKGGIWQFRAEQ